MAIPLLTGDFRYPGGGVIYDTRGFFRGDWQALWRDVDALLKKAHAE